MEAILKQISQRENPKEMVNSRGYMPRVHEVRAPCQWLNHCNNGKCPAFVRLNGNFYCAKVRAPT
ncbi:MAG: hypothetical protein ACQCN6_07970 [Candidatus Bathyarchaeia archaeon]